MPEPKPDARRAYASAPVNQRTAPRQADKPVPVHASLKARAQKARQRQLLGPSVSDLLARGTSGVAPAQAKLHPGVIAATVCSVAAACALILLRSGTGLALATALAALGGAGWLWQHRSQRAAHETMLPSAGPSPFEPEALRRIDDAFDATAAAVPESALAALVSLKAAAVQVALALDGAPLDGEFTLDDRLYVIESLRRYIPDTLSAYLQVPAAQRTLPGAGETPSANDLLQSQLALLQSGLEQRAQRLSASAVEAMRRQQRFLQAKATRR
ncbi:hypothetical protein RCH06_000426 [Polaromonas sp. CG_9.5]|uniref:hypothetical protein n=1 Tax=Polaromonas sp. CG_9.5 TaxID=3071705 RepID=UPI002DFEF0CE|nr:hypothetical protein [Polaromonas sp. CG_9.5]